MPMTHPTEQRQLDAGLALFLEHGYHRLSIQALLAATGTPKGSFYHHFKDKEDFALQVIDQYMRALMCASETTAVLRSIACADSSS